MKKVMFFTQNRWAFGAIHHGLCKELYNHSELIALTEQLIEIQKIINKIISTSKNA